MFYLAFAAGLILAFGANVSSVRGQPDTFELVKNRVANVQMHLQRLPDLEQQLQQANGKFYTLQNLLNEMSGSAAGRWGVSASTESYFSASNFTLDGLTFDELTNLCYSYSASSIMLDYESARARCESVGGELAQPENAYQFNSIRAVCADQCWLGIRRINGKYLLLNRQIQFNDTFWAWNQPDERDDEKCVLIEGWNVNVDQKLYAHNYPCGYAAKFVCQLNSCE